MSVMNYNEDAAYRSVSCYKDGDPINAETMNRPIKDLASRTDFLRKQLNGLSSATPFSSVRVSDVFIDSAVEKGCVVYLAPDGLYKPAKVDVLIQSNPFAISAVSSYAVGICTYTTNVEGGGKKGTIVFSGLITFDSENDIPRQSNESFRPGPYYLSHTDPGKITANPVGPAIYVGVFFSNANTSIATMPGVGAIIAPQYKDLAEMHHHRAFKLSSTVVGEEEIPKDEYKVQGYWRNCTSEEASAGYNYAYDVINDEDLNKFFPPTPLCGCALICDGVELRSSVLYPDSPQYMVTNTTIYWSANNTGTPAAKDLTFYTTRGKLPSSSFVTSLKAAEGSNIWIREEGTCDPANTGNLVLDARIPIKCENPGLSGYMVPKGVRNNILLFGPVVEKIEQGPGISVNNNGQGIVTISSKFTFGYFNDVALHNAKQEILSLFPYIKLLESTAVPSAFTLRAHIPAFKDNLDQGRYIFTLKFDCFALSDPSNGNDQARISCEWSTWANESQPITGSQNIDTDVTVGNTQILTPHSIDFNDITVDPTQDINIAIRVSRGTADSDNYDGQLGFLNMAWELKLDNPSASDNGGENS